MVPDLTEHSGENNGYPPLQSDWNDPDHPGTDDPPKEVLVKERHLTPQEQYWKETDEIPPKLRDVERALQEKVGLGISFDVVFRKMVFGGIPCGFFFMNGFGKEDTMVEVIKRLTYVDEEELGRQPLQTIYTELLAHNQAELISRFNEVVDKVLAGMTALFIEGERTAILFDAKNFPVRSVEEPDLEKVVRGSRDGFVETMLTNVTLIRRRIRDPRLKFEIVQVGERTKSDICLAYITDVADPELVDAFRKRLQSVKVDGIPMAEKQLEEAMISKGWNPYPTVRFSERPDVVAAHLLDGHIALIADTSPSVILLPSTFFDLMQHAEEYRQTPLVGTYLRWVRYFGILASLFLLPLWYLLVAHPEFKPPGLEWIGPQESSRLPILLQFILAELGVDLMRMAAVHTPTPLATAMGLVAAVLIGDIAVKAGLFVNEVILYLAVATIGTFATPSYELSMANRLFRLFLLIATAVFKVPGFVGGVALWLVFLALQRPYGTPYLWPFIPFDARALFSVTIRRPFGANKIRPAITNPQDRTRRS